VRTVAGALIGGFDRREVVEHRGIMHVVTMPEAQSAPTSRHHMNLN
jgi:hypothetical protein